MSARGALLETRTQFRPGSRATLHLSGTTGGWTVPGSVSRVCVVAAEVEQPVVYQLALTFDNAFAPTARAA